MDTDKILDALLSPELRNKMKEFRASSAQTGAMLGVMHGPAAHTLYKAKIDNLQVLALVGTLMEDALSVTQHKATTSMLTSWQEQMCTYIAEAGNLSSSTVSVVSEEVKKVDAAANALSLEVKEYLMSKIGPRRG